MKNIVLVIVILFPFVFASAQQSKQIQIMRNDGGVNIIPQSEIDSIVYLQTDIYGNNSNFGGTQVLYTKNKVYYIPIESIIEVLPNMQNGVVEKYYYSIENTSEESGWDSLMLTSNGYCAAIKTDSNEVITIVIDVIGSIDSKTSIIAQFNPDLTPISMIADGKVYYFINYRDNLVDIVTVENGGTTTRTDVNLGQIPSKARGGVSQNHYADVVNRSNSVYNIAKGGAQGATEAIMTGIDLATQNGTNAETKFVLSLSGFAIGAKFLGGVSWPTIIGNLLLSAWKYGEDKLNECKKQSYRLFAGNCEVETLAPEKVSYNSYRIGVRVKNANTIPSAFKRYNTYGLILKKVRLDNTPPYALNLYDKSAEIIYQQRISNDGDFPFILQDIEPGYKYLYRAFVLPYGERMSFEVGKGSANSSFAYYGEPKQISIDYARIKDYSQKSVSCNAGKLKFVVDVTAEFKNTRYINDISQWGVCLYKNGVFVEGKDYSIISTQTEGTVTIEFETDKESMTNDETNFIATTKDHWSVGTYVDFKGADYYARSRSEEKESINLIYDEKPSLRFTSVSLGGTQVYNDGNGEPYFCSTEVNTNYIATGTYWVNTVDFVVIQGNATDNVGYWDVINDGEQSLAINYEYPYGRADNSSAFRFDFVLTNGNRVYSSNAVQVWGSPVVTNIETIGNASSRSNEILKRHTRKASSENGFIPRFVLHKTVE